MEDTLTYISLFPQVREYSLISVVDLEEVIRNEKPLNSETLTRSKKKAFKEWLPMLRVILAAILEGRFVGPDWMNRYQMAMVHFPEQTPGLPEPPTFSGEASYLNLDLSDNMQTEEFVPEHFLMLPLAQSTPRHQSSFEESTIDISFADTTIDASLTILMNDTMLSVLEPSSPQKFGQEVLVFSFNSGYSCNRSALMSPTSPPNEWVDKTMEIEEASE